MKLGFCGLGNMGGPMALRLFDAGHDLTVWNRTPAREEALAERGARVARSPAEAAQGAEGLITMLADPAAVEAVVLGDEGVAAGLTAGATLIDMSTVGPATVLHVAERLPEGVTMLDAPVRGGPAKAAKGELKILLGASDADAARWTPVLAALGDVRHVGGLGAGAAAKVLNNFVGVSLVSLLGEAVALAGALGIDEPRAVELLRSTPIGATIEHQWPRVEAIDAPPSFRLRLAAKDLGLAVDAAADRGVDVPMGRAAREWMRRAEEAGLGDRDQSSVVRHIGAAQPD